MPPQSRSFELFPDSDGNIDVAPLLEAIRGDLLAYVLSLLPQAREEAEDVVQSTCRVLWEKRRDFQPGTDFRAWAFRVAYFQALAVRRDLGRNRVAVFSDETLKRLAGAAESAMIGFDDRIEALRQCIETLSAADRELVTLKYAGNIPMAEQARRLGVPPARLQKTLSRLRLSLKRCVEKRLNRL